MRPLLSRLPAIGRTPGASGHDRSAEEASPVEMRSTAPPKAVRAPALDAGPSRDGLLKRLLAFADALAALLAGASLALAVEQPLATAFWASTSVPLWLVLAKLHGLYDRDESVLHHLTVDEFPSIAAWAVTGTAGVVVVLRLSPAPIPRLSEILVAGAIAAVAGLLLRAGARVLWRATTLPEGVLVIGAGSLARATRRKIKLFPHMHVHVVGSADEVSAEDFREAPDEALFVSNHGALPVERVILASETIDERLIAELVAACRRRRLKLSVVPPVRGMFGTAVRLSHVADLPVVEYNTWEVARSTLLLKRVLDLAVGVPLLVLALPVIAFVALAVRLDSAGPSLFRQRRAGAGAQPFRMVKFRTMESDAERRLEELGVDFEALSDPMFKLPDDPRVTGLGKLLRRTSLDELPQLLNVVKGDMSMVGPRPEELGIVRLYAPEERFRLSVKPGLTGPMQVYGRGDLQWDERLAVEREYVENLSLARDVHILAMTAAAVLGCRGAY